MTPFTVNADHPLGERMAPWLARTGADVTIAEGDVPEDLPGGTSAGLAHLVEGDRALIRIPSGMRFLVERGERITYHREGASDRNLAVFLLGTAWGALCHQRRLIPLHASAVMAGDKVHAFTGQSGVGKSTLTAALVERRYPFFADDLLVIDPASETGTLCFAGHKRLKLWEDALMLAGSVPQEKVRDEAEINKFYARPGTVADLLSAPLASLTVLTNHQSGDGPITPVRSTASGAAALPLLSRNIYRPHLAAAIWPKAELFAALGQLASRIDLGQFNRSMLPENFAGGLDVIDDWLRDS